MTLPLFDVTVPIGTLPAGTRFLYDGWGSGIVTSNDGVVHTATLHAEGHQVATLTALNPGQHVTPT